MKKALLFILLTKIFLFAYKYNDFLLRTQSTLIPKILLLDKKIYNKQSIINIAIIFDENDLHTAFFIKSLIMEYYANRLENFKLKVTPILADEFVNKKEKFDCVYILKIPKEKLIKINKKIKKMKIESFTYDKNDLKYGFLFSIDIEKDLIIFMNKKALNKNFDFFPQLYQMVRFINNAE